jgi:hypothetical protein
MVDKPKAAREERSFASGQVPSLGWWELKVA